MKRGKREVKRGEEDGKKDSEMWRTRTKGKRRGKIEMKMGSTEDRWERRR